MLHTVRRVSSAAVMMTPGRRTEGNASRRTESGDSSKPPALSKACSSGATVELAQSSQPKRKTGRLSIRLCRRAALAERPKSSHGPAIEPVQHSEEPKPLSSSIRNLSRRASSGLMTSVRELSGRTSSRRSSCGSSLRRGSSQNQNMGEFSAASMQKDLVQGSDPRGQGNHAALVATQL